jgi:hypothetical protein
MAVERSSIQKTDKQSILYLTIEIADKSVTVRRQRQKAG